MNIVIYSDNVSVNHILYYALGKLMGKQNISFINANEILQGALSANVDLFVMPGGASRYKSAKLSGTGNRLIKDYVANGGCYLGICAGAYLACETTHWAKDQPFEIITQNELDFFAGIAQGPISKFGKGDNYNSTKPCVVTLTIKDKHVKSLYLGGCAFIPNDKNNHQVLATFDQLKDKPAAIVQGQYKKGSWLLCSTHPEYDHEAIALMDFNVIGNDYQAFSNLENSECLNLDLLNELLSTLLTSAP